MLNANQLPSLLTRFGLAFVFTYAAISMSLDPEAYAYYLPAFVKGMLPTATALHIFGAFEILLSLWLLSGKRLFYSSLLATLTILALTVFNLGSFNILFRNVSIFFSSLGLTVWSWPKLKTANPQPGSNQQAVGISSERGFTLIEILVAISIMSILFGVVITAAARAQRQARDAQRLSDLPKIQQALQQYYIDQGFYPAGLNLSADSNNRIDSSDGNPNPRADTRTYMDPIIHDPQENNDSHYCYVGLASRDQNPSAANNCDNSITFCRSYRLYARLENSTGNNMDCTDVSEGTHEMNYSVEPN